MSEQHFDVVFYGILQPGKDKELVMKNMATLFKTEVDKLAPYFAGGRKAIKRKVDSATGEKYLHALENVGLVVKLEPSEPETNSSAKPSSAVHASDQQSTENAKTNRTQNSTTDSQQAEIDTDGISVAQVGADILENPAPVVAQEIDDISNLSMAETGVDIIENPEPVQPQPIDDISRLSMADVGCDVLENPVEVVAQKIDDISAISMAEVGADMIENPKPVKKTEIPDTSELSLSGEKQQN